MMRFISSRNTNGPENQVVKFLTLKWDISRTIWFIEVSDGLLFFHFIFNALLHELYFFRPEVPFNTTMSHGCRKETVSEEGGGGGGGHDKRNSLSYEIF